MRHDTKQDYQAPPRFDAPAGEETRDQARDDSPAPYTDEQARHADEQAQYSDEQARHADEQAQYGDEPVGHGDGSRRYEPPTWNEPESATGEHDGAVYRSAAAVPSDPDTAEPQVVAAQADAATPVDTPSPVTAGAPVTALDDGGTLWPADAVSDFQQRWREVQLRFVDDPRDAAQEAQQLVSEVLDRFTAALSTRKAELDSWGDTEDGDTEQMRTTVRRYRKLLDRLLEV